MPGHGEDFLGARMVPLCFLCDRDLLVELGFSFESKKSLLDSKDLAVQAQALRERGYRRLKTELKHWEEAGYQEEEMAEFLARLYREQEGGGPLVKEDRKERRMQIRKSLQRLREDPEAEGTLRAVAARALEKIEAWVGV